MSNWVIRAERLSKQYRIGPRRSKGTNLRDVLVQGVTASVRQAGRWLGRRPRAAAHADEIIWALRDVSFEVRRGEAVGIVGRNGAGKSTLLKILSRITEPTTGLADLRGRVGSLLEVGTGFHPELTGRENIFLNGAILGMRRREIEAAFDEIVAFAEVERFIDMPVKHYSSGMYLRLAFSVAAHLEPEILLVDEVLAVGDAAFQRKCLGLMGNVARQGRTVLLVSHNMGAITQLCGQAFWIADGQLRRVGPAAEVVSAYLAEGTADQATWNSSAPLGPSQEVRLQSVRVLDTHGCPAVAINFDAPFRVELQYEVIRPIRDLSVAFHVLDAHENVVFEAMDTDLLEWKGRVRECGPYRAECTVPASLLKPGRYHLSLAAFVERVKMIEKQARVVTFEVTEVGYRLNPGRLGVISPVLPWQVLPPPGLEAPR